MIRILLVDDQPLFVESLRMSLENYTDDLQVVGIAKNGTSAIAMAESLVPDVILMDFTCLISAGLWPQNAYLKHIVR
jgi:DNA-binding NarL/FixJ family response regulator